LIYDRRTIKLYRKLNVFRGEKDEKIF